MIKEAIAQLVKRNDLTAEMNNLLQQDYIYKEKYEREY